METSDFKTLMSTTDSPEYSLIAPLVRDYRDWELQEDRVNENMESRRVNGICKLDVINLDSFICNVVVNGILKFDPKGNILQEENEYKAFKAKYPFVIGTTFENTLTLIARTLSEHMQDAHAFYVYRGEKALNDALTSFLAVMPYLNSSTHEVPLLDYAPREPDQLEADDVYPGELERHHLERERNGISWYDAVDLDDHLAGVFAVGFKILSQTTHGHPVDVPEEEWEKTLLSLSDAFKNYYVNDVALTGEIKELFVDRFKSFWD